MKRAHFTYEQHQRVGAVLKDIERALSALHLEVAHAYGKSRKVSRHLEKAERFVGMVRAEMESEMFRENPDLPNEAIHVYYPRPEGAGKIHGEE